MKALKILIIVTSLSAMIFTTSCKKDFFTSVNINPNAPDSVNPASLLATVEGSVAYIQGGDLSRYTSMFSQQTLGAARQAQGWYSYIFTTQDFDQLWGNLFTQDMENDYLLIELADEKGYHQYAGEARILLAYSYQLVVDAWGSAPYSQAFEGLDNLHPAYDSDVVLYDSISNLIDEGITDLNQPVTELQVPAADDFMYGGDAAQWIKFGHAIKARLDIHLSKDNAAKAQEALSELSQAFLDNSDNAQVLFGVTATSAAPWNQFNTQRGDISFAASTLAGTLISLNDPRYPVFIDSNGDVDGLGLAAYYGSPNSPVEFICYDELKFIEAEAILRSTGDLESAQTAFQQAITANMEKLGVASTDINTYIASNGTFSGTVDDAINQVGLQVWIALYLNPEAWTTYRRTGSPVLVPVSGNEVPRRFLYPQTEYSYNGAHVPASSLFTPPVFWDN